MDALTHSVHFRALSDPLRLFFNAAGQVCTTVIEPLSKPTRCLAYRDGRMFLQQQPIQPKAESKYNTRKRNREETAIQSCKFFFCSFQRLHANCCTRAMKKLERKPKRYANPPGGMATSELNMSSDYRSGCCPTRYFSVSSMV